MAARVGALEALIGQSVGGLLDVETVAVLAIRVGVERIGLGLVDQAYAKAGKRIEVRLTNGHRTPVTVMEHHAHFDPEGMRLHG